MSYILYLREIYILIYDARVGSKLLYGLHTLPLNDASLNKLNVFHLRGLIRILGSPTTYVDREYTNKRVLGIAEVEANRNGKGERGDEGKPIKLMSVGILDRSREMLGDVLRQDESDIRRQVTLLGNTPFSNLPRENRVGSSKTHWTFSNMRHTLGSLTHQRWISTTIMKVIYI